MGDILYYLLAWVVNGWLKFWREPAPPPMIQPEPKYRQVRWCIKCKHRLTKSEWAYSEGCCPHCGNLSLGTFVDSTATSEVT
ncbi:hypothetical protein LCGC14_0363920 [marine sediment metagenome]|uniref:Uncharacterized protein n=1 Tax=marine sediment metagenome TaxID=412755 RepID=A0A0F9WFJ0_9ZZZZ